MLHQSTVEPRTFSLLKKLLDLKELQDFALVGGTALSLKFGHRISVDLDLFSQQKLDITAINDRLSVEFDKNFKNENPNIKFAVFCFINEVKIDLVHYPHNLLKPLEVIEGIRMYSIEDIAAMKINAILGRGAKKDFWDLVELLKHFSLKQIVEFHRKKFPDNTILISIPNAITYFEDAENSPDPMSLNGQTWENVKKELQKHVRDYLS
jgi:predicted nucleotidyltransferase component of viral defense system